MKNEHERLLLEGDETAGTVPTATNTTIPETQDSAAAATTASKESGTASVPASTEASSVPAPTPALGSTSTSVPAPTSPATAPVFAPVSSPTVSSPTVSSPTAVAAPVATSPIPAPTTFTAPVASSPVPAPTTNYVGPTTFAPMPSPGHVDPYTQGSTNKSEPASNYNSNNSYQQQDQALLSPVRLLIIGVLAGGLSLLVFYKCCKSWKVKREKQRLRLQSTRVDQVLGDMQMVGMDEYDEDDPELI